MNRLLLLVTCYLLISVSAYAQKAPGYYINLDHDTIAVEFSVTKRGRRAKTRIIIDIDPAGRAQYYDEDDQVLLLSPEEVLEISATYEGYTNKRMARLHPAISSSKPRSIAHNGYRFFNVHEEGLVKLLSYLELTGNTTTGFSTYRVMMIQYENEPLVMVQSATFKEDMMALFKDFPALAEKISKGIYNQKHLAQIIQEYNSFHQLNPTLRALEIPTEGF